MKWLLISICLLFLSYGCSKDTPTAPVPVPVPTLDTTTKTATEYRTIRRYDGENWVDTSLKVQIDKTWKYISHSATLDGRVKITGGYSFYFNNPTDNRVTIRISKFIFEDIDGIPIYEYELPNNIERTLAAKGDLSYPGSFEINLDNLDTTTQITRMSIWGAFGQEVE